MKNNAMYIAVGTPDLALSSLWRIWNEDNEIYVLSRMEAGKLYKLSLHSSGISRLAYLEEKDVKDPLITDKDPRVIWRWRSYKNIDGWDRKLDIVIPSVPLTERFSFKSSIGLPKGKVNWIDLLSNGFQQTITLLIAETVAQNSNDILVKGDKIIGTMKLTNGRVVWIRTRREKMQKDFQKRMEYHAKDIRINYDREENLNLGEIFSSVIEVDKDSLHPVITNYALSWDNVYVRSKKYHRQIATTQISK